MMLSTSWPSSWEFPVGMAQVVEDPGILDYLPLHSDLTRLLRNASGSGRELAAPQSLRLLLRTGRAALHPRKGAVSAARRLATLWQVSDPDLQRELLLSLQLWADRIDMLKKAELASVLWAYDTIVGLLTYYGGKGPAFPEFTFKYTYPLGRLVSLLSVNRVRDSLIRVLVQENEPSTLQFSAYLMGILNHTTGSEPTLLAREIRHAVANRREQIATYYPAVDRQLLWMAMQLEDYEAQTIFLRKANTGNGPVFEGAYNYHYYKGNRALILERYERRPQEKLRTDRLVTEALRSDWEALQPLLASESSFRLDPTWWPAD